MCEDQLHPIKAGLKALLKLVGHIKDVLKIFDTPPLELKSLVLLLQSGGL